MMVSISISSTSCFVCLCLNVLLAPIHSYTVNVHCSVLYQLSMFVPWIILYIYKCTVHVLAFFLLKIQWTCINPYSGSALIRLTRKILISPLFPNFQLILKTSLKAYYSSDNAEIFSQTDRTESLFFFKVTSMNIWLFTDKVIICVDNKEDENFLLSNS